MCSEKDEVAGAVESWHPRPVDVFGIRSPRVRMPTCVAPKDTRYLRGVENPLAGSREGPPVHLLDSLRLRPSAEPAAIARAHASLRARRSLCQHRPRQQFRRCRPHRPQAGPARPPPLAFLLLLSPTPFCPFHCLRPDIHSAGSASPDGVEERMRSTQKQRAPSKEAITLHFSRSGRRASRRSRPWARQAGASTKANGPRACGPRPPRYSPAPVAPLPLSLPLSPTICGAGEAGSAIGDSDTSVVTP